MLPNNIKTQPNDNIAIKYLGTRVVCGLNSGHRRPRVGRRLWTWCGTATNWNRGEFSGTTHFPGHEAFRAIRIAHAQSESALFMLCFRIWHRNLKPKSSEYFTFSLSLWIFFKVTQGSNYKTLEIDKMKNYRSNSLIFCLFHDYKKRQD